MNRVQKLECNLAGEVILPKDNHNGCFLNWKGGGGQWARSYLGGRKEKEREMQVFLLKGEYEPGNRKKGPSAFHKPEVGEPSQA